MRLLLTISFFVLASSTLFGLSPALAVDASISAKCGPDAPEGYKRPGGYCEQIGANSLLSSDSKGAEQNGPDDGPEDQ